MPRIVRAALFALFFAAVGTSTALAQRYEHDDVFEERFDIADNGTLTIDADLGSITVEGSRRDDVYVRVVKGANGSRRDAEAFFERFELSVTETGHGLEIIGRFDRPRGWRGWSNRTMGVRFEIEVPEDVSVDLKTAGGSIQVDGIAGEAYVNTSGGSLTLTHIDGMVNGRTSGGSIQASDLGDRSELHTSGGSITINDAMGAVECHTSGGSISIDRVEGPVDAETSGGSITLMRIAGAVNASTSGGSINAEILGQPQDDVSLRTSGGTVTVHLDPDVRADVDAQASGGSVRSDIPIAVRGEIKRTKIQGEMNGGGPRMTLRSSGGSVRIVEN